MDGLPILSITTFLPLAGALLILVFRIATGANFAGGAAKGVALIISLATFAASLIALAQFDMSAPGFQLIETTPWFGSSVYKLGVDGMALALILLTTALTPLCILQSMGSIKDRVADYMNH
jgi:NADH-quinone oxidoreductase subunit M